MFISIFLAEYVGDEVRRLHVQDPAVHGGGEGVGARLERRHCLCYRQSKIVQEKMHKIHQMSSMEVGNCR